MSADSPLAALLGRHSTPSRQLGLPAPDAGQLQAMLTAAVRVPDHGKLVPFRLLRIEGDARLALGALLAARSAQRNPGNPALIDKDRERFSHAPLIITVIACPQAHAKVPQWEQKDFVPVSQVVTSDFVLLVNPQKVPARNVPDFVAWARQRSKLALSCESA